MDDDFSSTYKTLTCPQCGGNLPSFDEMVICAYCGARLIRQAGQSKRGGQDSAHQVIRGMRFTTFICDDAQGTGLEAFRMLIPAGWQTRGGVHWPNINPGMPAVLAFQVFDPNGPQAFEVFPNQPFYWSNDPMTRMTFPVGSFYFGNEVRSPMGAHQALRELILPRFRAIQSLQITGEERLPDLAEKMKSISPGGNNPPSSTDGARINIRYPNQTDFIDEEIYGVMEYSRNSMPSMWGMFEVVFWVADYLFSFRARSGQLDGMRELFQTILASFKLNPQWFGRVMQISQYMIQNQMQQINNIGQLSRYISQTQNQISDMIMDGYHQRQQTLDRLSDRFSQAIRGVEAYYDPNLGRGVELPGGYGQAWSNPLGEYIVSDDPNFNPNLESNLSWTELNRKE